MPTGPMGPSAGGYGAQQAFANAAPTSRAAEWLFNQSGMVVILSIMLLGVWYVGRDHLNEFKAIRAEEKIEQKAERSKFLSVLEACCKDKEKVFGFNGQ